jgi:hypothetical protein
MLCRFDSANGIGTSTHLSLVGSNCALCACRQPMPVPVRRSTMTLLLFVEPLDREDANGIKQSCEVTAGTKICWQ